MNRPLENAASKYETVAAATLRLIEVGVLRVGQRAPSLRATAGQHGISLSTALQAYRVLEDRGILQARPKSGFFVVGDGTPAHDLPRLSNPPPRAQAVAVGRDAMEILERAADPRYVPLGCAIPDAQLLSAGGLDRFLARAARVHGVKYNIYTEPRGNSDLRQQISHRALRFGQVLAPDDIAVTCGCTEALALALRATTKPGDTVALESPTYFGLLQILENQGLRALELPTHPDRGLEPGPLEAALETGEVAVCLLSASFNNPLGCTMSEERKKTVAALLARHGVPLIEDDIYGDIYFGEARPKPFAALAPDGDIVTCGSFSKTVAPGYRVGWVSSRRRLRALLDVKFGLTLCGPALPQLALAEFLASGGYDNHLRRIRRAFADNIHRMQRAIGRSFPAGTRVSSPQGGFVLWVELPDAVDCMTLYRAAIAERICFAPGALFTATEGYKNCLRLSCGHSWDRRIERSVERLGELASAALD
ncbi:MAG TPA: PLP-dependent aminotransferase family protein [Kiloniellaceae bacterium]|nr:PLP-dependent aminotransferase family protein [Kiloniellaceae bacterium]